jgi:hypothetical protein
MEALQIIGWSVTAAVVGCRLAWNRARVVIDHISAQADIESRQWKAEAMRWRAKAARLSQENDAWRAGHQEGRADVISIVPLLVAARQDGGTCTCATAAQITSGP